MVLESRWKEKLADWIPSDSLVVNNFSNLSVDRSQHKIGKRINLLLMSRGSRIKGHNFAKDVLCRLLDLGYDARLRMTGVSNLNPRTGAKVSRLGMGVGR